MSFFDGVEGAGGEQGEDAGAEAGGDAGGHQDGFAEHVGVDLVEHGVVLRNAAGVDDAVDGHAVLGHALEDDAGVEGGAFDGGEELVLRGVDQVPAEGDAAEFGIDEDGAVAVVPGEAQQAGLAGAIVFEALRRASATLMPARRAMASKMSPVAERPASMPVNCGMDAAGNDAADAGDRAAVSFAMAMMQVEVPTTLTTSPSRQPAPMASQWASNAPTGMGMPARRPSLVGPLCGERWPARWSEVRYSPPSFSRMPSKSGSSLERKDCGGRPPHLGFHIHLWPMAQTLRLTLAGSVTPHSVAATMSQCSKAEAKLVAFVGIVAQPVEEFGEAPLVRVDAAAPLDGFEVFGDGRVAVICLGFGVGAMIAPEVVVVEGLQVGVDGDDAGAGGVERDGGDVSGR